MINNMRVIGLTGGSGAGKGEVSSVLMSHGIKCLDTDRVSREVCQPGKPCLRELCEYFGEEILLPDGRLDRRKLADMVFGEQDEEQKSVKLAALNRITHKHIVVAMNDWLKERESCGDRFAVVDAPQLFESGFDRHCDYIVGVIANEEVRTRRIVARDRTTVDAAKKRIASQKSDKFFTINCDFVIYNNAGIDALETQVENMLDKVNFFG